MAFSMQSDIVSKDFNVSRISALDGVRGIAFLMVFSGHTGFLQTGNFGVDLFFVLSGFLITSILLQENTRTGSISYGRFYLRRALRLLPALFGVVLFVLAYTLIRLPFSKFLLALSDSWRIALYIWNWTLAADWQHITQLHQEMFTHLWSLSVEEQFYIVWPCLLVILLRIPRSLVLTLLVLGIVIPGVARWLVWHEGSALWIYFRTDFRFDNLLYGALVAWALHWGFEPKGLTRKILSWAGLLSLIGILALAQYELISNGAIYQGILSLVALFSGLLIASAIWCPLPPLRWLLNLRPLRWTGKISYGLYLWHWPIILIFGTIPFSTGWGRDVAIFIATYSIAAISFYKLEQPFLRMKNKFGHAKKAPRPIASPSPIEVIPSGQISYQQAD